MGKLGLAGFLLSVGLMAGSAYISVDNLMKLTVKRELNEEGQITCIVPEREQALTYQKRFGAAGFVALGELVILGLTTAAYTLRRNYAPEKESPQKPSAYNPCIKTWNHLEQSTGKR